MTRRSSGIHAAWHFWYAASFGGESSLREVGLCGIHPLTQRYASCCEIFILMHFSVYCNILFLLQYLVKK
ncbi:DUF3265 domain-containing protein [Vibrio parahaemolyticus]|nr:DUF3265 domain-containing protein [Vibrio parahaemolyticus]ELA8089048.1 DUF3265 domain-containing protein [Vibrio parahaemolyticus]ELA8206141.1 DUF3265 domain-containing protein [Vibrio parahaemolyticus]ELB2031063.1 DUF3265 domain-containing protein [Vibrio parahaemolyticus]ELB2142341.1 DUF3265 domain-containing protein [Vibrio parahaemolyticus]